MKKQAFNPFLPEGVYIPDGEPHVFDERVYLYGSHDKEGGCSYCMEDYEFYSASIDDLSSWTSHGSSYHASQDPLYPKFRYMFAPDCVKGNDGRYYLYYCMANEYGYGGYTNPISVAVSSSPDGPFEFYGYVKNKDGSWMKKYVCFDPAVMNDNGIIRLYYGTSYPYEEEEKDFQNSPRLQDEINMFGKSKDEILSYKDSINGAIVCTLEEDMLTIKEEPKHLIPYRVKGTSFEKHPFFEASSMRKIKNTYYFIYSSWQNHELCYATSKYPDHVFTFKGTIISNGDIGYQGRKEKDKTNMTGTTHGSIEKIRDQWYVFYHRLTHKSDYSRQACAEEIKIAENGFIAQVEMTSCGLNQCPLIAKGNYPSYLCCTLTNGHMPHGSNSVYTTSFPNINNQKEERFIQEISNNTLIGFKYFEFQKVKSISLVLRKETGINRVDYKGPTRIDERCQKEEQIEENYLGSPYLEIKTSEKGKAIKTIDLSTLKDTWTTLTTGIEIKDGIHPIFFLFHTKDNVQFKSFGFQKEN